MNSTISHGNALKGLVLIGLVLLPIMGSFILSPLIVWTLFAGGLVAFMLMGKPSLLIVLYWVWNAVLQHATRRFVPDGSFLKLIGEILLLLAVFCFLFTYSIRRGDTKETNGYLKWTYALYAVIFISILFNGLAPKNLIYSFTSYYLFPLVFLATAFFMKPTAVTMKWIIKLSMGLLFLCVPLNIGGFLGIVPWARDKLLVDRAMGTFNTQGVMGFYSIGTLFMCLGMMVHAQNSKSKRRWTVGAIVSLLTFVMTFNIHMYVYLIVLYIGFVFLFKEGRVLKLSLAGVCAVSLFVGILVAPSIMGIDQDEFSSEVLSQFDPQYIQYRIDRFFDSPKMELFHRVVIDNASWRPMEWLLGNGPGQGTGRVGVRFLSSPALEYLGEFYFSVSSTQELAGRSVMSSPHIGILSIWTDIGAIGFLVYIVLHIFAALHLLRNVWLGKYSNRTQLVIAESCVLWLALLVMASMVMSDLFYRHELLGGIWIVTALVWTPIGEDADAGLVETDIETHMVPV